MADRPPQSIGLDSLKNPDPDLELWLPLEPEGSIGVDVAGADVFVSVADAWGGYTRVSVDQAALDLIRRSELRVHFRGTVSVVRKGEFLDVFWCNQLRGRCSARSFALAWAIASRQNERQGADSGPTDRGHVEEQP